MNRLVEDLHKELKGIKNIYPLYKPFIEIEYQLDLNKVVVFLSYPYDNIEDSDYESHTIGSIEVEEVYDFIDAIYYVNDSIIISDTTEGQYYHKNSLDSTLGKYAKHFAPGCIAGREWLWGKPMTCPMCDVGVLSYQSHEYKGSVLYVYTCSDACPFTALESEDYTILDLIKAT